MQQRAPSKLRLRQWQAFRDDEDGRGEKGVEKPIASLPQQIGRSDRIPPAEMYLGDPVNNGESGGQGPGGRNEHPRLKTLRDSHQAKVLHAELGSNGGEYAHMIDDRSRQQTRRSRIYSCRVRSQGLDCGINT